jgi:hypothetical protein
MRAPLRTNPSIPGRNNPLSTYLTAKLRITKTPPLRAPSPKNRRANKKKRHLHTYIKLIKVKNHKNSNIIKN